MTKSCELCRRKARIHCAPDHASLCWDCDAEVHSANFLVARHSRNLLCHVCQSPTPWTFSGSKLRATPAVCHQCAKGGIQEVDEEVEPEEIDNQGMMWSPPPPPSESSYSISSYEPSDEEHDSFSSYVNVGAPPPSDVASVEEWHPRRITDSQGKIRRRDSGSVGSLNSGCCKEGFGSCN